MLRAGAPRHLQTTAALHSSGGRGNYRKISYVAIVVLDRETSNQVRMWLGKKIVTPRSEKKNVLNILIGRYIVHFLVTGK